MCRATEFWSYDQGVLRDDLNPDLGFAVARLDVNPNIGFVMSQAPMLAYVVDVLLKQIETCIDNPNFRLDKSFKETPVYKVGKFTVRDVKAAMKRYCGCGCYKPNDGKEE